MSEVIKENIQLIRRYTQQYQELRKAHHFLYDKRLGNPAGPIEFISMGINPGEPASIGNTILRPKKQASTIFMTRSALVLLHKNGGKRSNILRALGM